MGIRIWGQANVAPFPIQGTTDKNFPQAFTHLALISAAYDLNRKLGE